MTPTSQPPATNPEAEASVVDHNGSIRAEFFNAEELREYGERASRDGVSTLPLLVPFDFHSRSRDNEKEILRVYRTTAADVEEGETITPAAEWLLDNHYIVEEAILQVRRDLPRKFYRQLAEIDVGGMKMPRALALAWLYVAHTHSTVSQASLKALVDGYQTNVTMEIGELWALPSLLRFVLIENLRRISIRVERARRMRGKANDLADQLIRLADPAKCADLLANAAPIAADCTFATQFLYRLRDGSQTSGFAVSWLDDCLKRAGTDSEEMILAEHNRLASGNVTMGNIIKSLREIDDAEWPVWFEDVSVVDKILREGTDFADLDFGTRDVYRDRVERLARRSDLTEEEVARRAISISGHCGEALVDGSEPENVGEFLVGSMRASFEKSIGYQPSVLDRLIAIGRSLSWISIALPVISMTLIAMALVGKLLLWQDIPTVDVILLLILFALPASEGVTGLFNTVMSFMIRPARLAGYEFKSGIPAEARTLVAVPCLISNRDGVDELIRNIEVHYLANPRGEIYFALLSDWPDSQRVESEADQEILAYARQEVDRLSSRYAHDGKRRFYLLHRRRLYNPSEGAWMGWERKRGKLHELNLLLRGDRDTSYLAAPEQLPADIQYVMTLDADTRITRDAVTKLVGKMHHPINRPVLDPASNRVVSGYGILQPRVTPSLTTGKDASVFQRIFSINRGLDPYVFTVSDVYQDIAGEGTFTGKGLYHVDAFEAALKGRIDENTVLSHDLLEGSFARCALVTDVELVEDFPIRYEVEMSRQHRWARGDWQLLPFIFNPKKGIPALGRWKMADNLRRSLTPIAWLLSSLSGWFIMDATGALAWQIFMIFSLFVAPTLSLLSGVIPRSTDIIAKAHFSTVWADIRSANAQVALRIVFIADTACMMGDAIVRSLFRMFVSHKHMLEWRTAASVQASSQGSILSYYSNMRHAPLIGLFIYFLAVISGDPGFYVGVPFATLWILSPLIAWYVSQSAETEDRLLVAEPVSASLRAIARRTWRYFETFVTEEHNFLPPDNYQEIPEPTVANRTSPTNIGVYLLSVISAREFGWISFEQTIERLEQTVATVDRMEKYRGHLLNWYHTDTLKPMKPRYVSAVDSGNLAGHLIAVSSACRDWAEAPAAYLQGNLDGVGDVARILKEVLADLPDDRKPLRPMRRRLEERIAGFGAALSAIRREQAFTSLRMSNLTVLSGDIEKLAVNLDHEIGSPKSSEVTKWARSLVAVCQAHINDSLFDLSNIEPLRERLAKVRDRARDIAFSMDFGFLFRPERRLLSIGYRIDTNELDDACYDLLASEARLTSLFAIAKGDLPNEHWFRLGRTVVPVGARGALVSWSGSMFEYLMPPLVMQERQGGILNQTNNLVVKEQIAYAKRLGIPCWGISEAAFNARDHELTYQYSNFGVPTLGLKRGLGQNAVIAPYASLLASQYDPEEALENLERLRGLGALGIYGFHDAVDFTPTRLPEGATSAVVRNYMAHHHGMSIAAVANVAFNGRLRSLFHSDPVIEAAELLLQEKAPREIQQVNGGQKAESVGTVKAELPHPEMRIIDDPANRRREAAFLSNGHYCVMLTADGHGYSRWNGQSVSRWKADETDQPWGTYIFLRDAENGQCWSATPAPRAAEGEKAVAIFGDDKAEFQKTVNGIYTSVECIVATEHDAEGRRVSITNNGMQDRFIEVTSYLEPVIASDDADAAHPLFSKMFVQTEIGRRGDVIRAWRNKRNENEPDMFVAHLVSDDAGSARPTEFETDRRRFIGRGRMLADAAAFLPGATLSSTDGFTLDPILSLRRVVRVPAGKKVAVIFWTIAAPVREEADKAIERYRHPESFAHEMAHAWTRAQVQMRHIGVTSAQASAFSQLGRCLVYPDTDLRADAGTVRSGLQAQSALWPLSISGDFPIYAVRINDDLDLDIVREALTAQSYLRLRGVIADLVIVNERATSYAQDMQQEIDILCENLRRRTQSEVGRPHVFSVRRDLMSEETWRALLSAARAVFHARNGKLTDQIVRAISLHQSANAGTAAKLQAKPLALPAPSSEHPAGGSDLDHWNGFGGFSKDGKEYVVRLSSGQSTPHPWINVIANESFGFHVSAEGNGFTWSCNSRDYQLTSWSNDPVINRSGEAFYIADVDSGQVLAPVPALSLRPDVHFEARHGLGSSQFKSQQDGLDIEMTQTLSRDMPAKVTRVRIRNTGMETRHVKVYGYAEWVLGNRREKTVPYILTAQDEKTGALFARNPYSVDYSQRTAFFLSSEKEASVTASSAEFLGRHGSVLLPEAVAAMADLSGNVGTIGDPCAALCTTITIAPYETREICFLIGDGDSEQAARDIIRRMRKISFATLLKENQDYWAELTGKVRIKTPDTSINNLVNYWLPYQALSCRITARAGFYQASGAFGFRDQLQDSLAMLAYDPSLARNQILRAASRQFQEGDVQHWWLPESGAGVRTHIADDVVWLAYAAAHYSDVTGDLTLLDEEVPFIHGPVLFPGQHDAFFKPDVAAETASLYEHVAIGLDLALSRTGPQGLPLMLGGDWNDAMNRVGEKGKGESVWLGWFLANALKAFIPHAEKRGDEARAAGWQNRLDDLLKALESAGWDGEYYRRGFYDDGRPLGSAQSEECRIDSISQSWSVLSGLADPKRAGMAMDAVVDKLVDEQAGLIRLFDPPFATSKANPGYIKAYPPGVRENGGQYTHAAIWVLMALAKLGRPQDVWRCLSILNPVNHSLTPEDAETYRCEPYVVTADIYGEREKSGRGGWSWYTGSAGWLHRAIMESVLGISRRGGEVQVAPMLPAHWDGFEAELSGGSESCRIEVQKGPDDEGYSVRVNGKPSQSSQNAILVGKAS
jgi:cyclic beta-1,2-glucan synthetase